MPYEKTIQAAAIHTGKVRRADQNVSGLASFLSAETCHLVQDFHSSLRQYGPTPLVCLPSLARELGVGHLFVKDESHRFGLNAFKVLGASYAIARYLCERIGLPVEQADFERLRSEEVRRQLGSITFVTVTDGNHGRAVAWAAAQLGHHAVVYLPKGSSAERVAAICETSADAHVINGNYDEAVRLSEKVAQERGWQVVQDTAWNGYTTITAWIMRGYMPMAAEAISQLAEQLPGKDRLICSYRQASDRWLHRYLAFSSDSLVPTTRLR